MNVLLARILLNVLALTWGAIGLPDERSIRVVLVLYEAPTGENTALDPYALGIPVTEYSQLTQGGTVYLEAWVSTAWPFGLSGAGLDVTYDPALFSTFCRPTDPGHPGNCQVFLGDWTRYASCPIFYGVPDGVCSENGQWCDSASDCMACFGGPSEGSACLIGPRLCNLSGFECTDATDCMACFGGANAGDPCVIGATICSTTGQSCDVDDDCRLCEGGSNQGSACIRHRFCSDTGAECRAADDCFACTGGSNDGLACDVENTVCENTAEPCTTPDDCKICVLGANAGLYCTTDGDCPDGTCEVSGEACVHADCPDGVCEVSGAACEDEDRMCSDSAKACAGPDDCTECVGGDNDGLVCAHTVCSDTGQWCLTDDDCKTCVGGDNDGAVCVIDSDCLPDGSCEVSGETCGEKTVCSDTGVACVTADDCMKCVGGASSGLACSDTVCSDTGEACSIATDCKKCVGGDNNGFACVTDDDCPPDGSCEVSGETCEVSKICSDTAQTCLTADDCMKCVGGDHDGDPCTIKGTVCSSNGEPCTTADDCKVCSSNSEPCTTADDCKKCSGGENDGLPCTIDDDCPGGGTCVVSGDTCDVSGDTCDDEDCRAGGTCQVSGETCDDTDCWPGGTCEVSGEVCHDVDCPVGGMCEVTGETCDDRDCPGGSCTYFGETCDDEDCRPGGTCDVSGETCDDADCWPGGTCAISGETCEDNPEKDCVPIPGVVQNVGGNNMYGKPPSGWWERIATIEFDVEMIPADTTVFYSGQDETAGGDDLMLAYWGGGAAAPDEIQFFPWVLPGGASDTDQCVGGINHGNPCDDDGDCDGGYCAGDGVFDALDNCPSVLNPGQEDDDHDNIGNVCDNCPADPNFDQADSDQCVGGSQHGNPCADDTDCEDGYCAGDDVGDVCDNCPDMYNPGQEDTDVCVGGAQDGAPCEYATDCPDGVCTGDGVGNSCDNCPHTLNFEQLDCDADGLGDACETDPDDDQDNVLDTCDNCPTMYNPANTEPFDCNEDGDTIDPGEGVGEQCDSDGDGIGDVCECPPTAPPGSDTPGYEKIRYISLAPANPGRETALRVTLVSLPAPFDVLNGTQMWVGPPQQISENAGALAPPPYPAYYSSRLQCEPYCTDFGALPALHITDDEILPGSVYDVQTIGCECAFDNEINYSPPFTLRTSRWGDLVADCTVVPCGPPDGYVNMGTDVTAVLDKFKNLPNCVSKPRADLEPNIPDSLVNISDVLYTIEAFKGFGFPFAGPDLEGCPPL